MAPQVKQLNDDEVQREVNKMVAFIKQEALEKAREIKVKADEEYSIEKGKIVRQEQINIDADFDKKMKQADVERRTADSNAKNKARLEILRKREEKLEALFEEGRGRLGSVVEDKSKYGALLEGLLLQGYYQLLEREVLIRCREADKDLVKQAIESSTKKFKEENKGVETQVRLDDSEQGSLPKECSGGVVLVGLKGRIKIDNTLDTRMKLLEELMLPEIRTDLFGKNENRRFYD